VVPPILLFRRERGGVFCKFALCFPSPACGRQGGGSLKGGVDRISILFLAYDNYSSF